MHLRLLKRPALCHNRSPPVAHPRDLAHQGHDVRRGDGLGEAQGDLSLGYLVHQVLGAHQRGPCSPRILRLLPPRKHCDVHRLARAKRQGRYAPDVLRGLARVNAQLNLHLHRFVKGCRCGSFHQLERLVGVEGGPGAHLKAKERYQSMGYSA